MLSKDLAAYVEVQRRDDRQRVRQIVQRPERQGKKGRQLAPAPPAGYSEPASVAVSTTSATAAEKSYPSTLFRRLQHCGGLST